MLSPVTELIGVQAAHLGTQTCLQQPAFGKGESVALGGRFHKKLKMTHDKERQIKT